MAKSWLSPFWSHPIGSRLAFYPTVLFGIIQANKTRRWYDKIDGTVILGALPFHKTAYDLVCKESVTRVVALNEAFETRFICPTKYQWASMGVKQLSIPTVDYNNAPSMNGIKQCIHFIKNVDENNCVYVHCKAGRSRSATIVLCYLMEKYNMDCSEAIKYLKSKRPHIVLGSEHMKSVTAYHAYLQDDF